MADIDVTEGRAEFDEFIQSFLQSTATPPQLLSELNPDEDLFAAGLLDSLRMIELVERIEDHYGREIPLDRLTFRAFRTPEIMWTSVVEPLRTQGPTNG